MGQTARFQETLPRAIFDEGFVEAGFGPGLAATSALIAQAPAEPG